MIERHLRRTARLVLIVMALLVGAAGALAQKAPPDPEAEVLFGTEAIAFTRDRDMVKVGRELGQFTRIRLRVLDADITLRDAWVVYANGETDRIAVNADLRRNASSRWLDVKPDRFIREVQFTYTARPGAKGGARVEIYGDLAPGWTAPGGRGKDHNQGWILIGAQSAGRFFRNETDTIPFARNAGFKRLRIDVKHRAIVLSEIRLVYVDSDYQNLADKRVRIEAGQSFGPVDINDETNTAFKELRLKYRSAILESKPGATGPAVVEVWGRH